MRRLTYSSLFAVGYLAPWAVGRLRRRRANFGTLTSTWNHTRLDPQ